MRDYAAFYLCKKRFLPGHNNPERGGVPLRTLWKGAISFGLVNIPVRMYTATQRNEVKFNYLHKACNTPLRYVRYCPNCEAEVDSDDIVWGYEYQKGQYIVLNEEDFDRLPDEKSHTVDILDFVDLASIDPIYFDKTYFLDANEGGEKAYELLIHAMKETGKVAIARVMIRTKETLAALRIWQDTVVMETMFYHDEVRRPESLPPSRPARLHENEIKMAVNLVQNLSTHFEPEKYTNEYRQALREMIEAKIAGEQIAVPAAPETGKVIDLMDALKASLAAVEQRNAAAAEAGGGGQPRSTKTRQTRRKKAVT
jgi:DNA end-binding protein Ku